MREVKRIVFTSLVGVRIEFRECNIPLREFVLVDHCDSISGYHNCSQTPHIGAVAGHLLYLMVPLRMSHQERRTGIKVGVLSVFIYYKCTTQYKQCSYIMRLCMP